MTAVDPLLCPLCRHPNECGMAAGKGVCWCFSEKIRAEVLEKIPQEAREGACVCRTCGLGVREATEVRQRMQDVLRRRG